MEIRHLKTFLAVARLLSFNKAADRLHYAQSSVSAQIRDLETELAVPLFQRLGRTISLTEAGERLIPYAEKMVDLADQTRTEMGGGGEPGGSLTVRMPESLGTYRLSSAITEFKGRFPNVRLKLTNCTHDGLHQDLQKGVTDAAFLLTDSFYAADVEVEALGFEPLLLVASPGHRLAGKRIVRTRDLEGEVILLSDVDCSYKRLLERLLEEERVPVDTSLSFHSVETLKQCAIGGAGITILPKISVSEEIRQGKLKRLAWEVKDLEVAILMIWRKAKWLSPSLKAFMETVRKAMRR